MNKRQGTVMGNELRLLKTVSVGVEAGILLRNELTDSLCKELPGLLLERL
jgi:hypothetical protein